MGEGVYTQIIVADEPAVPVRPFWGKCWDCGYCWPVCYLPLDMGKAAKLMKSAACPKGCSGKVGIAKQDNGELLEQATTHGGGKA